MEHRRNASPAAMEPFDEDDLDHVCGGMEVAAPVLSPLAPGNATYDPFLASLGDQVRVASPYRTESPRPSLRDHEATVARAARILKERCREVEQELDDARALQARQDARRRTLEAELATIGAATRSCTTNARVALRRSDSRLWRKTTTWLAALGLIGVIAAPWALGAALSERPVTTTTFVAPPSFARLPTPDVDPDTAYTLAAEHRRIMNETLNYHAYHREMAYALFLAAEAGYRVRHDLQLEMQARRARESLY